MIFSPSPYPDSVRPPPNTGRATGDSVIWPCRLVDPTSESRKKVTVELARLDHLQLKEMAITQNVSARGIRLATEHLWRPGDRVLLNSPESTFHSQARVVYCQRLEN